MGSLFARKVTPPYHAFSKRYQCHPGFLHGVDIQRVFTGDAPICFAGLWDRCTTADAGEVESFTLVTQPPNPELLAYHDRAPVVLQQADWATWLDLEADVRLLLGVEAAAGFDVAHVSGPKTEIQEVDWVPI